MRSVHTSFQASSGGYGALAGLAFMVFVLIYTPCLVAIAAERQELERPGQSEANRQHILSRAVAVRHEADPQIYAGREVFPSRVAWLGQTGYLRGQRYVEVHLAPVRYDPRIDGLRIQESLEVVVHFNR